MGGVKKSFRLISRWLYRLVIKRILFLMAPDRAHSTMLLISRNFCRIMPNFLGHKNDTMLSQDIFGIEVKNPIGIAAGLDKNAEMLDLAHSIGCGFTTVGSVTFKLRKGNPHPWFHRLLKSKSLVVNVGMANKGLSYVARRVTKNQNHVPLVVSVAVVAHSDTDVESDIVDYACKTIKSIEAQRLANVIELNVSCPNICDDQPFAKPRALHKLLIAVDKLNLKTSLTIKLPNSRDWIMYKNLLDVVLRHNVQGVVIANLVKDRKRATLKDQLSDDVKGGLSGLPTQESSVRLIGKTFDYCGDKLVIVGVGGTFSAQDAYIKIRAGASMVGLVTGLVFEGPQLIGDINYGIDKLLQEDGYQNIRQAVGADRIKMTRSA